MEPHPTLQVLASPTVRRFVASRFFRDLARTGLAATISWHVYDVTGSAFMLGLLGLVEFVPVVPVGLWAGALADAGERVSIIQRAQAAFACSCLGLGALTTAGMASIAPLLGLAFLIATADAFESPATSAVLPNLVPREIFPTAVTVLASVRNAAWATGPVVAGFLIAGPGVAAVYFGFGVLALLSIAMLASMRVEIRAADAREASWAAIREGISFVRHRQPVLGAMTLDLFAVIFAGVNALLPVFASDILEVGPRGYGLLAGALQVGTFLMASILLFLRPFRRPGRALLLAVTVYGIATLLFGASTQFELSVLALVLAGMADEISMVTRSTIIQLSTPDELRGRVSAVNMVFIGASNELGAAESGFLAALTSATFSVLFGGVACLATVGIVTSTMPELRRYRTDATAG